MHEDNTGEIQKLIKEYIESEIRFKQELIARQQIEIDKLHEQEEAYKSLVKEQQLMLQNSAELNEGNKQLMNKLLGDIGKLQNDVDWYKRTYEQRSFLGTIREKLRRKM